MPSKFTYLTFNQIVAFNLEAARHRNGWTQERAARELGHYLGARWSKANLSAAERSIAGKRIKRFHADEIAAIAKTFGIPVWAVLLPPAHLLTRAVRVRGRGAGWGDGMSFSQALEFVLPTPNAEERKEGRETAQILASIVAPYLPELLRRGEQPPPVRVMKNIETGLQKTLPSLREELTEPLHSPASEPSKAAQTKRTKNRSKRRRRKRNRSDEATTRTK